MSMIVRHCLAVAEMSSSELFMPSTTPVDALRQPAALTPDSG